MRYIGLILLISILACTGNIGDTDRPAIVITLGTLQHIQRQLNCINKMLACDHEDIIRETCKMLEQPVATCKPTKREIEAYLNLLVDRCEKE